MLHNREKKVKDRDNMLRNDSVRKDVVREQPEFSTVSIQSSTTTYLKYFIDQ